MKKLITISSSGQLLRFSLLLILPLILFSCGSSPAQEEEGNELPSDFKTFYKKFHSDSTFQMDRIVFPLQGRPEGAKKGKSYPDFRWKKDEWELHRKLDDLSNSFRKIYSVDSSYITEMIYHKTGIFNIERRFSKIGGQWYLVYYAAVAKQKNVINN